MKKIINIFLSIMILCVVSQHCEASNALNCLEFTGTINTAFIAGDNGMLYKSSDGGQTWYRIETNIFNNLRKITFGGLNNILVVGDGGIVLKSSDNGSTWETIQTGSQNDLYGTMLSADGNGYIVGSKGILINTSDFGSTWSISYYAHNSRKNNLNSISVSGSTNGIITGNDNFILRNSGRDRTWQTVPVNFQPPMNLRFVRMISSLTAFAVSTDGRIIRSTDGGATWNIVYTNSTTESFFRVSKVTENRLVAAGENGKIIKSEDQGLTWQSINSGTRSGLYCMSFLNESRGLAAGDEKTIIETNDGGLTWNPVGYILNSPEGKPVSKELATNNYGISLNQNYPNPFNPTTNISYSLPFGGSVSLKVYDMLGKEITSLVNKYNNAGTYTAKFDGSGLASGIYFYVLKAVNGSQEYSKTMKMILTK